MNSQYHIDTQKLADYPLPAGHMPVGFSRPFYTRVLKACFSVLDPYVPLFSMVGRRGTRLRVLGPCVPVC